MVNRHSLDKLLLFDTITVFDNHRQRMILLKKAMVKNKKSYATFMFIPESQSTVKSFRIPLWFPKAIMISTVFLIIISVVSLSLLSSLKKQHDISKKEIENLTSINNNQKVEIQKLKNDCLSVQRQLEENSIMLNEVKKAVGIEPSEERTVVNINDNISSNEYTTAVIQYEPDLSEEINKIESNFTTLTSEISNQKQEIEDSIAPIKNRLAYLMAKPSILPVNAAITAGYGYRKNPFTSRGTEFHRGIDFAASYGQKISATGDGVVTFAGLTSLYAHNSELLVKQGDKVKKGQAISKAGNTGRSTGTHLHYEIKLNGKNVDPSKYFE
jgi:murein DD-endopeptidase MepM/ murein hydrolase activator NlpD